MNALVHDAITAPIRIFVWRTAYQWAICSGDSFGVGGGTMSSRSNRTTP
jgi:hypothetical protein